MNRTIHAQSGHTLHVSSIDKADLPKNLGGNDVDDYIFMDYETFYEVRNWDKEGVVFMYLGKGYKHSDSPKVKNQIVVWYRNGGFWSGYGTTLQSAIDGAQKDGWMYA